MKKIRICTGLFLLGLLVWIFFWTPDMIVCRNVSMIKFPKNEWIIGRINRDTAELHHLACITSVKYGWEGLILACWAPSLFLLIAGGYISYYAGHRQMKEKMEKDFPYAADLSMKSAIVAREKEDLENDQKKFNDERTNFENKKDKFYSEKGILEFQLQYYKEKSEGLEKTLGDERRDHNNRKDKVNNLETRLNKMELEKIASEKDKLALEREKLDLYAENIEMKRRLNQYEDDNKS